MGSKSSGMEMSHIRDRFVEWSRYPDAKSRREAGEPETITAFGERWGVSRPTLWRWKNDASFQQEVVRGVLDIIKPSDYIDALIALRDKAKSGNVQAFKTMWSIGGFDKSPVIDEDTEGTADLSTLSDEEIEAMLSGDDSYDA